MPLPASERSLVQIALAQGTISCPSAHYALLMIGGQVVAADRSNQQPPLDPQDVTLLANFVTSNRSYRRARGGLARSVKGGYHLTFFSPQVGCRRGLLPSLSSWLQP